MDKPLNDFQRIIQHEIVLLSVCKFLIQSTFGFLLTMDEHEQVNQILADARVLMPQYSEQLRSI